MGSALSITSNTSPSFRCKGFSETNGIRKKADPHPRSSPCSEGSSCTFVPLALALPRPDPAGLPGSSRDAYEPLHLTAETEVP